MLRKLYHGSKGIIQKPVYGYGKKYNDYGLGLYCTEVINMAKEWAATANQNGYANCYELDCSDLKILDLNAEQFCILHWLTILLQNREFDTPSGLAYEAKAYLLENFKVDYSAYDAIIGYRADDSYFSFAQDFINGTFSLIKFTGYELAEHTEWFDKKNKRDKSARREYFSTERNKRQRGDIYITQIMDEEMKSDDARLR